MVSNPISKWPSHPIPTTRFCYFPCYLSPPSTLRPRNQKIRKMQRLSAGFGERITVKMTATTTPNVDPGSYDRLKEVKQFDESKIGVKGLVDAGLTAIPRIFHHPPENLPDPNSRNSRPDVVIPVIDFSEPRPAVVEQVCQASSTLGFFQITNHGVPQPAIDDLISSIKWYNELPESTRMEYYGRDMSHGVSYASNVDLYQSKAASWRDTLQMRLGPTPPDWDHVPVVCREPAMEWNRVVLKLGEELMAILCEGLGLGRDRLKESSCLNARILVEHYYPYCPQPDLTVGLTWHTDPGVLTVLVQNEVKGLQIKYGDDWLDVEPVPGAIVINIGDMLQIMSNDEYKSVEHRVLANPFEEPRVSAAVFFNPSARDNLYGPFPELVSPPERPAAYQQFTFIDFMKRFFSKELDGKTLTKFYRL